MVTVSPIVPEVGERDLMDGVCTVKILPTDVPTELVTCTGPVVAPTGTVQIIAVSDQDVMVAGFPLNFIDP